MKLSNKNIAKVMETIENFFETVHAPHKDKIKICLLLEESLIRYQEKFGESKEIKFITRKWLGTPRVTIKIKGEPYNPLEDDDEEIFSDSIMKNLLNYEKAQVIYRYEGGFNEIIALSGREIKNLKIPGGATTISILLAIIFALMAKNFSPQTQEFMVDIVTQVLNTMLGALIAINILLIFISIVTSMFAVEDIATLNTLGTTVLMRFLKILLLITVVTIFVSLIFFPVLDLSFEGQISSSNTEELMKIFDLITATIPKNIVEPFLKGNILQIVILALFLGVCITILGEQVSDLKKIILNIRMIIFKMISIVLKLIPAIIFLSMFKTLIVYSFDKFYIMWEILAAPYVSFAIIIAVLFLRISVKYGVKISDFLRKIYPACIITFTTSSGSASMSKNIELCKSELHIKENLCDFYIPLSHAICPTTMTVSIIVATIFTAEFSGMTLTILQLFIVAFLSIQFAIATPKENGGIMATMPLLFVQLGLSMDSIGLIMASQVFIVNISGVIGIIIRDCDLYDLSRTK